MGRTNVFGDLEDFSIFTPDDLKSIPLRELRSASSPRVQPALLRDLWNVSLAYHSHPDQNISTKPSSEHRPTHNAFALAAVLKGDRARNSILGRHHLRDARTLSLGDHAGGLSSGGPAERMKKLIDSNKTPAGLREFMESAGRLNASLACEFMESVKPI